MSRWYEGLIGDHWRVPTALAVGVHFWRLFTSYGGRLAETPGPVWEFAVRAPGAEWARIESFVLFDVNGDGVLDAVSDAVYSGDVGGPFAGMRVHLGRHDAMTDQILPLKERITHGRTYKSFPTGYSVTAFQMYAAFALGKRTGTATATATSASS